VAIVAVGVVLIALPLFTAAQSQTAAVVQTATANAAYQARLEQLRAAQKDLSATATRVAELRRQIPAANDFDDVFQVVNAAAAESGATVSSVKPGDAQAYAARTAAVVAAGSTSGGGAAPQPSASPSPDGTSATDSTAGSTGAAGATGAATPAPAADSPRRQIPVVVTMNVPDAASAAAFLDALAKGPRIITVTEAALSGSGSGSDAKSLSLTVDAITYTSSEG